MPKTPSKMHIYDMAKIDTMVFEIVGGGLLLKPPPPPPPGLLVVSNIPDRKGKFCLYKTNMLEKYKSHKQIFNISDSNLLKCDKAFTYGAHYPQN